MEKFRLYYDPNSSSNFNRYRIVHTAFEWNIDFDQRIIHGHVQFDIKKLNENFCEYSSTLSHRKHDDMPHFENNKLILDVNGLNIEKILYKKEILDFELNDEKQILIINLNSIDEETQLTISIYYSTLSNQCQAVQWLTKDQTADRKHPYLFSQCQAILARSLYPCQDSPGVKSAYTVRVTCPKPMIVVSHRMLIRIHSFSLLFKLMSAIQTKHDTESNTFYFEQTIPISSYLVAIAVGDLVSFDFSPSIRVWSEANLIEKCQYEFADTEQVLRTAEQLLGDYQWKRYDFIVLPPSLPCMD